MVEANGAGERDVCRREGKRGGVVRDACKIKVERGWGGLVGFHLLARARVASSEDGGSFG